MNNYQIREVATKLSRSGRFRKILFILFVAVVVLGLIIAPIENMSEAAKIKSEGDGLWFAITTVTGVGYGDMVPVTGLGRLVAVLLQVFGVVLFGAVMAFVSVELLRYQEDFNMRRLIDRMDGIDKKMDELKKHMDYLVKK